ncbi:MAG: PfkB family carbohydrate kinase [Candidatus Dormibacteria bacterium]
MTWPMAVAGTVHDDDITTPAGRRPHSLGGSAVYAALAASRHARVHLNGIVGRDTEMAFRSLLVPFDIDCAGLVVSDLPTFRWHARHDFERWVAVDTSAEEGCDPGWAPVLTADAAVAPVLFAASMRPTLQRDVLAQSSARLIGTDSMVDYTTTQRMAVRAVAESSDILFLNRSELQSLLGTAAADAVAAARSLCGRGRLRAVVVKDGPRGATCVTATDAVHRPAVAVATVVDPTGAGDALAGGFLGACAAAERDDAGFFATALEAGVRAAADAISAFGPSGLLRR